MSRSGNRRDPPRGEDEVETEMETDTNRIGIRVGAGPTQVEVGYDPSTRTMDGRVGAYGVGLRGEYDLDDRQRSVEAFVGVYVGATVDMAGELYGFAGNVEVAVEIDDSGDLSSIAARTSVTLGTQTAYATAETEDFEDFSTTVGLRALGDEVAVSFDTELGHTPPEFGPPSARGETPSSPDASQDSDDGGSGGQDQGGNYGGADPSAGGAKDSPNPADQEQGYGHVGPPVGSGSSVPAPADQTASTPDSSQDSDNGGSGGQDQGGNYGGADPSAGGAKDSPNPADQEQGYGHVGPPGGSGSSGGGKPVFLDLDGDGVELVSLEDSNAAYDIRGDGFRYNLSWVDADDGILAYDQDGDGQISKRGEISFVDYFEGARTDLEGLRHFDTNGDNQLTSADEEWSKFRVWQDLDGDGVSDPGELRTLDEAEIRSISLASTGETETRRDGTRIFGRGTYTTGSENSPVTRELLDVSVRIAPWGFRETGDSVEFRWTDGDESFDVFVAASDEPVTLDLADTGHSMAIGDAGADRLSNAGAQSALLFGLAGDDVLRGGTEADLILGGTGDDELYGGGGSDVLDGGTGADRVDGEAGDDVVHGGAGADLLDGGADEDTVSYALSDAGVTVDLRDADADGYHDTATGGHATGDRIGNFEHVVGSAHKDVVTGDAGDNWLDGGAGRDVLTGGAGNDTLGAGSNDTGGWQELYGESGDDTYLVGHADGQVRIGSASEGSTTGRADRVVFTNLTLADLEFTYHDYTEGGTVESAEGVALVIRWTRDGVSGEVRIADMGRHIERFEFADGSTLSQIDADWMARYQPEYYAGDTQDRLVGTSQDDTLTSGAFDDRLDGGSGNDLLDGGSGGDDLYGGFGSDTLMGGEGDDALTGDAGSDELHGGAGNDELRGGAGNDVLLGGAGRDWIRGDGGDDTLDAGESDGSQWQTLDGRSGNDTYRVGKSHGLVRIDSRAEGADTGTADRVVFTDLALSEVTFTWETQRKPSFTPDGTLVWTEHRSLVVGWTKDGESGKLWVADSARHIEEFAFADGSTLSRVEVDRLVGTSGADLIATGAGADTMDGGAGDDELQGGGGDDTYEFSGRAFGSDTVHDTGGDDTVEFSGEVGWDQLWFSRSGNDLLVELMGTESEVLVEGWWNGALDTEVDASRQVETFSTGDHSLTASAVQQLVQAMAAMDAPASGQTSLTTAQREQMSTALAGWQDLGGS